MSRKGRRHFGSIRQRPSGNYQASYIGPDGLLISLGTFPTYADADIALADVEVQLRRGTWIDPRHSSRTVEDVARTWLASNPHKRRNTYASDQIDLEKHIIPAIGSRRLSTIRPADVQRVVNKWSETFAPRTVLRRYGTLGAVFNFAVSNDWLARSPIRSIKLPKVTSTRCYPLTDENVSAIAEATVPAYRAMVWLGALTGCRWSEAAGLRIGDLNLLARTMRIKQVIVKDERGRPIVCAPKSDASGRVVSLPEALVEMLAGHFTRARLTGGDQNAFVFTAPDGGPLRQDNWRRRVWIPALETAGLAKATPRPGFHDLRRAVGTALVGGGVDPKTAQKRLGHSDVRTTLALYARAVEANDQNAAELLSTRFKAKESASLAPVARLETRRARNLRKTRPDLTGHLTGHL